MNHKLEMGLIQVYTGNGKGKTTAALGQALRSVGQGLKVCMIQFLKGTDSGELHSIRRLGPDFQIFRFENNHGFFWTMSDEQKQQLRNDILTGYLFTKEAVADGEWDVVILDEILGVLDNGLLTVTEVCNLIRIKPVHVELILTGRNLPPEILELAHLVTETTEIKHYYNEGITARKGIEY